MLVSIFAAKNGCEVTLFEKNEKLGKKLYITGKGRCNVTNDCSPERIIEFSGSECKIPVQCLLYIYQSGHDGFSEEDAGAPLKTERGNRVFPCSDRCSRYYPCSGKKNERIWCLHSFEKSGEKPAPGRWKSRGRMSFRWKRLQRRCGHCSYRRFVLSYNRILQEMVIVLQKKPDIR